MPSARQRTSVQIVSSKPSAAADLRHVQIGAGGHQHQTIAARAMRLDGAQRLGVQAALQQPRHEVRGPALQAARAAAPPSVRVDQGALEARRGRDRARSAQRRQHAAACAAAARGGATGSRSTYGQQRVAPRDRAVEIEDRQAPLFRRARGPRRPSGGAALAGELAQHVLQDAAVAEVLALLGRVDAHAHLEAKRRCRSAGVAVTLRAARIAPVEAGDLEASPGRSAPATAAF